MTLDHKTSHKGQLFKIEMYTSSESWKLINKLSIDAWFVMIGQYLAEIHDENLESEGAKKNQNIEKNAFKKLSKRSS